MKTENSTCVISLGHFTHIFYVCKLWFFLLQFHCINLDQKNYDWNWKNFETQKSNQSKISFWPKIWGSFPKTHICRKVSVYVLLPFRPLLMALATMNFLLECIFEHASVATFFISSFSFMHPYNTIFGSTQWLPEKSPFNPIICFSQTLLLTKLHSSLAIFHLKYSSMFNLYHLLIHLIAFITLNLRFKQKYVSMQSLGKHHLFCPLEYEDYQRWRKIPHFET